MIRARYALAAAALLLSNFATAQAPALQEIQDRLMIEEVMVRYVRALDNGDAYGALFTEDGAGEYHDKLVKRDGRWYFQQREIRGTMSVARPASGGSQ